jgi:hypothetical protein
VKIDPILGGDAMDSYIVHIYKRQPAGPESLVGTIKLFERQEVKIFKTVHELIEILMLTGAEKEKPCNEKGQKNTFSRRRRDCGEKPGKTTQTEPKHTNE